MEYCIIFEHSLRHHNNDNMMTLSQSLTYYLYWRKNTRSVKRKIIILNLMKLTDLCTNSSYSLYRQVQTTQRLLIWQRSSTCQNIIKMYYKCIDVSRSLYNGSMEANKQWIVRIGQRSSIHANSYTHTDPTYTIILKFSLASFYRLHYSTIFFLSIRELT